MFGLVGHKCDWKYGGWLNVLCRVEQRRASCFCFKLRRKSEGTQLFVAIFVGGAAE
uniref:Uncharacterized protein n=1 Tax=Rhizophora mucronata TaxID=61149 RepID=A0A2P2IN30_RHIMU